MILELAGLLIGRMLSAAGEITPGAGSRIRSTEMPPRQASFGQVAGSCQLVTGFFIASLSPGGSLVRELFFGEQSFDPRLGFGGQQGQVQHRALAFTQ